MRGNRSTVGAAAATVLLLGATLSACTGPGFLSTRTCLPAKLQMEPADAAPGDVITVTSSAADCDLHYGESHRYRLTVRQGRATSPALEAPVHPDGAFTATVRIPAAFTPGEAWIVVDGSPYDQCTDTGSGSCAGYAADLTVR